MSIELPPDGQGQIIPESSLPHRPGKRKREEEKVTELVQKSISHEEPAAKKLKKTVEAADSQMAEDIDTISSKVIGHKRKAADELEPRKRQKREFSPNEQAIIQEIAQKQHTNNPEEIIHCLDTLLKNNLINDKDPVLSPVLQSLLENIGSQFSSSQYERLIGLFHGILDFVRKDQQAYNKIVHSVSSFTAMLGVQDILKSLTLLKIYSSKNLETIVNAILEGPRNKLSLEQKIRLLSFIHENNLHIDSSYWQSALLPIATSEYFQNTIKEIPEKDRAALFRDCLPLFTDKESERDVCDFLALLSKVPQEERPRLIQDVTPFFDKNTYLLRKHVILMLLAKIPYTQRAEFLKNLSPFVNNKGSVSLFLYRFLGVPETERESVVQNLLFIRKFAPDVDCNSLAKIVEHLKKIPQEERAELLERMSPLFLSSTLSDLFETLADISQAARKALLQDIPPELIQTDSFKYLIKKSPNKLSYLLQDVLPHLNTKLEWKDKLQLLLEISKLRTSPIQGILPFLNTSMNDYAIERIVGQFLEVPEEQRSSLVQDTLLPLTPDITAKNDWMGLVQLLKSAMSVPQSSRSILVRDLIPIIHKDMSWESITYLFRALHKIPEEERSGIIQDATPLLSSVFDHEKAECLATMHCIPKEQRNAFIQQAQELLPVISSKTYKNPSFILYLLPESLRTKEKLQAYDLKKPEYRNALIASIEQKLRDEKSPEQLLLRMAHFVTRNDEHLGLNETHPLFEQAVELISANSIVGEKNPFSLYRKLQVLAQEPTQFTPPEYEITGKKTALRLQHLQEVSEAFRISREELPQDATEEAWSALVNGLKNKVEADEAIKNKIPELYMETTWDEIWNNSLSDSYFSGLLKSSKEKVSIVEAQFRALLHNILTKEKEVKPGEVFSEQEHLLIMQAITIQKCSTGKSHGIAVVYNRLPSEYKYQAKDLSGSITEADESKLRAKEFIADLVQTLLSNQFTDSLVLALIGIQEEVKEPSHQILYLKNLIGKTVGLVHDVTFDKYTGVLYEKLVEKSRDDVLKMFFDRFTPHVLVKELVKEINSDSHKKTLVREFLTSDPVIMEESYDYDDDLTPILNERGALNLLQQTGYLT
jgi:hypothetical protein